MVDLDGAVFVYDVAFFIAAEFPGLYQENVTFPYPESPLEPAGDAANADFAVHAPHFHPAAADALFADAENLIAPRGWCSSEYFFGVEWWSWFFPHLVDWTVCSL